MTDHRDLERDIRATLETRAHDTVPDPDLFDQVHTTVTRRIWGQRIMVAAGGVVAVGVFALGAGWLGSLTPAEPDVVGQASTTATAGATTGSGPQVAATAPHPTDAPEVVPTPTEQATTEDPSPAVTGAGDCSARGMDPEVTPQPELPDAVATLRAELARAAVACDWDRLEQLMSPDGFTHGFGASTDAVGDWQDEEARVADLPTEDRAAAWPAPMQALRALLDADAGMVEAGDTVLWGWPRLHTLDPTTADQGELQAARDDVVATGLYTPGQLEQLAEVGGYGGYRILVTYDPVADTATWTVLVAGD